MVDELQVWQLGPEFRDGSGRRIREMRVGEQVRYLAVGLHRQAFPEGVAQAQFEFEIEADNPEAAFALFDERLAEEGKRVGEEMERERLRRIVTSAPRTPISLRRFDKRLGGNGGRA